MNFLKNVFNKVFTPTVQQPLNSKETKETEQTDISEESLESLKQIFQLTAIVLSLSKQPTSDELKLQLYSFYKQSTVGNCSTAKPALYQFVAKAKWEAWNNLQGMTKANAMKNYIRLSVKADSNIQKKIQAELDGKDYNYDQEEQKGIKDIENVGLRMVEQKDYSSSYSHPYFKAIEKGQVLQDISHELLLQINNNPKVYPLHFAIDKEREDLVPRFLELLTIDEIKAMKDEEGTGILQYAQIIENDEILSIIRKKYGK